jgi:hypothetical protein
MNELIAGDNYRLEVKDTDTHPKAYYYVISQELRTPGAELRTLWPVKVGSSQPTEHEALAFGTSVLRRIERAEA